MPLHQPASIAERASSGTGSKKPASSTVATIALKTTASSGCAIVFDTWRDDTWRDVTATRIIVRIIPVPGMKQRQMAQIKPAGFTPGGLYGTSKLSNEFVGWVERSETHTHSQLQLIANCS